MSLFSLIKNKAKASQVIIQPKLSINTPGDQYEQEADAMADRVMRMPGFRSEVKPVTGLIGHSVQRKCTSCEEEEKKKRIMRKGSTGSGSLSVSSSFSSSLNASKGSGSPLPDATKSFMENAFSADFSSVRVHADSRASEMSKGINAKAFTYGNDIYFNGGAYDLQSEDGKRLLAHELVHVSQQNSSVSSGIIQRSPGSPAGGCGLCYGNSRNVGIAAHQEIEEAFVFRYPWIQTEYPVLGSPGDDNGKLDLADIDGSNHISIGEIKPANSSGLFQGDLDLFWYEQQLRSLGIGVSRLSLPPPIAAIPFPTLAPSGCLQTQSLYIEPAIHGIYTYWCSPDYSELIRECDCRRGRRVPVPVPIPFPARQPQPQTVRNNSTWQTVRDFVSEAIRTGQTADAFIVSFLQLHPEIINYIILVGVAGLVATFAEDIATLGAGIIDDLVTVPLFAAMIRIALTLRPA